MSSSSVLRSLLWYLGDDTAKTWSGSDNGDAESRPTRERKSETHPTLASILTLDDSRSCIPQTLLKRWLFTVLLITYCYETPKDTYMTRSVSWSHNIGSLSNLTHPAVARNASFRCVPYLSASSDCGEICATMMR